MLTLIPHATIIIDLINEIIAEENDCFLKTFGIAKGSNIQELRKIFVQTPLLVDADKTITMDLKARKTNVWLHGLRKTGHHGQLTIRTEKIDDIYILL